MIDISIVIPVYNSADCLAELLSRIRKSVAVAHEVIFVNDQSTDNSWKVIEQLAKSNADVTGVNLRMNSGQDNAIMAGLLQSRGRFVVIMDDDLQHDPRDISNLYEKCLKGADVCYARFVEKKQLLWKNFGSWFNGKVAEWMLRKPKDLYLSPYKMIHADVVKAILKYDGPYPYIDGLILSVTNNIVEVPAAHQSRYSGRSNFTLFKSLAVWANHVTGYSVLPLRVATFSGIVSSLVGFILGVFYIIRFLSHENPLQGWTTLVVINLFIGGLLLMALGLIGEYVGRSYLLLNRKPQFLIKDIIQPKQK